MAADTAGGRGFEKMGMGIIVLLVAAIMPWASVGATFGGESSHVLDVDGEPLKAGSQYYVLPPLWGPLGGGLTLRKRDNECPYYVAQERSDLSRGLPVIFTPFAGESESTEIREGVNLKVESVASNECGTSNAWRLRISPHERKAFVATGDHPTPFTIVKSPDHWGSLNVYAFRFSETITDNLGIYFDNDSNRWLVSPTDRSFPAVFVKVTTA